MDALQNMTMGMFQNMTMQMFQNMTRGMFFVPMKIFHSELTYKSVDLRTAADIVQHSFIVQNSISPLNLELCQSYGVEKHIKYPSYSYSKDMINTQEKCRKVHTKRRNLLYTLHLDLPKGREFDLKRQDINFSGYYVWRQRTAQHIHSICIDLEFYSDVLYSIIEYACKCTDYTAKIVKWFLASEISEHLFPHWHTDNYEIQGMHPELGDLEFVTKCRRKIDLSIWILKNLSANHELASNLLYQLHQSFRKTENMIWFDMFTEFCLSSLSFELAGIVLKFKNSAMFCGHFFQFLLEKDFNIRCPLPSKRVTGPISQQRSSLFLQVVWVYLKDSENLQAASEFLRLTWNSVPDSFLSFNEISWAQQQGISSTKIAAIHNFYSKAVGVSHWHFVEPRSLKHYCRIAIRRRLYESEQWLSDGIRKIGLPKKLQSYLNLKD